MRSHTTARDAAGRAENSASSVRCRSVASAAVEAVRSRAESSFCKVWRRVFSDGATAALAASRQRKSPSTGSAARRTTACASDEPSAVGRSSCRQPSPARSSPAAVSGGAETSIRCGWMPASDNSVSIPCSRSRRTKAIRPSCSLHRKVALSSRTRAASCESAGFTIVPWPETVTTATPLATAAASYTVCCGSPPILQRHAAIVWPSDVSVTSNTQTGPRI